MNETNKTRQPLRFRITREKHDSGYSWLEQLGPEGESLSADHFSETCRVELKTKQAEGSR